MPTDQHRAPGRARPVRSFLGAVAAALLAAAVVRELRLPAAERTWHGSVLGVPYDLRPPTWQRVRESWWAPDDRRLLTPRAFGVGWAVNLARLARTGRCRPPVAAGPRRR